MKFEASVIDVIPRTSEVCSFRFDRPEGLEYKPGQYMLVTIEANGKNMMHPFSFSSSPSEKNFVEFTKRFTTNEYSVALKSFKKGDRAKIDAPHGNFTFTGEHKKVGLLTGGVGITPFMSICKYATDKKLDSDIVLLFGCRAPEDIPFYDDLKEMQSKNENLKVVFTVNQPTEEWNGSIGNIGVDMVKKEMPDYEERIFYACGPPGMVEAMKNLVKELGLKEERLKLESFAGY